MKTHLQQAAKALLTSATEEEWYAGYAGLRKALDAELAQSVEPDAWMRHDSFKAMTDDEKAAWIESGNAEVVEEYTKPLFLHPPQPQAMTRALVTQMLEAMEEAQKYAHNVGKYLHGVPQAITAARNYLVIEPDKQRADLVTQLRACLSGPAALTTQEANAIEAAANTLEEYARKIESLECDYTDQVLRAHAAEKVSMTKLHQIELQAQLARKEAYILELEAKLNED